MYIHTNTSILVYTYKCINIYILVEKYIYKCSFVFFFLFRATLMHVEVPRLGVQLELQLLAYATATATQDP